MTDSQRPRTVEIAFWLWALAALGMITAGLLVALSTSPNPALFRGAGALFVVAGAALAYLAGRTRNGDLRFRNAGIGLALAVSILLALFSVLSFGLVWVLVMILAIVGAVLMLRPSSQAWFVGGGQDRVDD